MGEDRNSVSKAAQVAAFYSLAVILNAVAMLFFIAEGVKAEAADDCLGCILTGAGVGATTVLAVLMHQIHKSYNRIRAANAEITAVLDEIKQLTTQHSNLKLYAGGAIDELSKYDPAMAKALTTDIRLTACSDFGYR